MPNNKKVYCKKSSVVVRCAQKGAMRMQQTVHSYQAFEDFLFLYTTDWKFPGEMAVHFHDRCELLFVKKGDITYIADGKSYRLSKNSLILSRPMENHTIIFNDTDVYERYNILFDHNAPLFSAYHEIPQGISVVNFNGNELVCSLFKKMEYYCNHLESEQLKQVLQHLTHEVLINILISAKEFEQGQMCTVNPVITKAIAYIDENITAPLQVETLCEVLYITKSYLHHLFAKHMNITPKKYIMLRKLHMVQRELAAGGNPTQIAVRYGFTNYSTFYRNYRKVFGSMPSDGESTKKIGQIL